MRWPARVTTPALLILPVHRDTRGVYTLYCETDEHAGLVVATRAGVFLREQVLAALRARLGTSYGYELQTDFFVQGELCGVAVSAVLVSIQGAVPKLQTGGLRTFAQFLRVAHKSRDRLIYLKAWQFLAGMAEVKAKVISSAAWSE